MLHERLIEIYDYLKAAFGPQNWWPGDTPFEIIIGAILTQNTSWKNVEKALKNLKENDLLTPEKMHSLPPDQLAALIKPAGYFNVKTKRVKNFLNWLFQNHRGDLDNLKNIPTDTLREEILSIKGIGPETADSILLYALDRPTFVIDTYTARLTARHNLIEPGACYEELKYLFQSNLPEDTELYNEYHALIVQVGKQFCKPTAKCEKCPLNKLPHNPNPEYF